MAVRLSTSRANRPGTHFCYRLSRPQCHSAAESITSIERSKWLKSGIESATFRLVAPCYNQLCYRVPPIHRKKKGGGGIQLGPLGTAATNRHIVSAPGDYDNGEIGGMIGRGNRSCRKKTCRSAALSTTNPTCCPEANPGRPGGKPASNRLSYGTAFSTAKLTNIVFKLAE
jgi:hypothetical protein